MVLVDYLEIFFTCTNTFGHILYVPKVDLTKSSLHFGIRVIRNIQIKGPTI